MRAAPIKSSPEIGSTIADLLAGSALSGHARLRHTDPDGWACAWRALPARPVGYSASMIDYMHAYFAGAAGWTLADASLVLTSDGRPCGVWPLTLGGKDETRLTSQGEPILPPLFTAETSPRTAKKIIGECLDALEQAAALDRCAVVCAEPPRPGFADEGLSDFYQQAFRRGAETLAVRHDMYVDLRPSMDAIRSGWRKSYRPLVTSGLRAWSVHVADAENASASTWEAFRQLHCRVAGRETRPRETWDLQWRMILAGEALLVWLADPGGLMVGGGFFQFTDSEALYSVAAYDRDLFDKPLGHVVQARAIEEFKRRGLSWYKIGELKFAGDRDEPSAKELSIGAFKQGFASHLFAKLVYEQKKPEPAE
jgi:FemAB family protein